jgi:hypothetical protein
MNGDSYDIVTDLGYEPKSILSARYVNFQESDRHIRGKQSSLEMAIYVAGGTGTLREE